MPANAPCPHYSQQAHSHSGNYVGSCGGCQLQHLSDPEYSSQKHNIAHKIANRLNAVNVLQPTVFVGPGARHRIDLKASVYKGTVQLGFYAPKSHAIVNITECPVAEPTLAAAIVPLRDCLQTLKKPSVITGVSMTSLKVEEVGMLDICLHLNTLLHKNDKQALLAYAAQDHIIRLSVKDAHAPAIALTPTPVYLSMGGISVELPPNAFLQATKQSIAFLTTYVGQHTASCRHIVDLYAGCGTYSLALAAQGKTVIAYESSQEMVTAMQNALRRHNLEHRLQAFVQNLHKNPVTPKNCDAAVINPPRAGAANQVKAIIRSGVATIVMISCNPATFERDARTLIAAGYTMTDMSPLDQFHWSTHLEIAAVFSRQHKKSDLA